MKATRNLYHIDIEEKKNYEIEIAGKTLYFDPEYRPMENAMQYGTVLRPPMSIGKHPNMTIPEVGDTVYFHHHIYGNKVEFEGEAFRWGEHFNMFFIMRDDEIIMLNDYVLCEPIMEEEESSLGIILKSKPEKVKQRAKILSLPKFAEDFGLKVGDEITFGKNADYPLDINGDEHYIMSVGDIIAFVMHDEGKEHLIPVGEWTLIEPLDEGDEYEEKNGILLQKKTRKEEQHRGLIHKTLDTMLGIKDGDKVLYDRRGFYAVTENDKKFYGVNTQRDIFILL